MKYLEHIGIFSHDEITNILRHSDHRDYDYITNWFGEYEEDELNDGYLCWGEGNDFLPNEYWIVDYKTETAMTLRNMNDFSNELKNFFDYIHKDIMVDFLNEIDITEDTK